MPITIRPYRAQTLEIDGTVFEFRPIADDEFARIQSKSIKFKSEALAKSIKPGVKPEEDEAGKDKPASLNFDLDSVGVLTLRHEVLKATVKGWKNLVDSDGKEVPFSKDLICYLPGDVQEVLFQAVTGSAEPKMEAVARKN